jgi:hypothetical protein
VEPLLLGTSGDSGATFGSHQLRLEAASGVHARIPRPMWQRLVELILASGMSEGSHPGDFTGCTQGLIATLPNIELIFVSGSLVYYPEDYIELNQVDGTCSMRVTGTSGSIVVEPLFLANTNVRVTRQNVWDICESALIA